MWTIIFTGCCFFLWLRYLWSRRRFYYLSRKMHGPFSWPFIGNSLIFIDTSRTIANITKVLQKYPSPLRFYLGGTFSVILDKPEDVEIVMTSPESIDRGKVYEYVKDMIGGHGLFTIGGESWKMRRKLLNPTIQNYNILTSFYPIFNKNMRILIDVLERKVGKGEFNVCSNLECCTLDMICETEFGISMNIQGGENLSFLDCVRNLTLIAGVLIFQPWFRPIFRLSKYYHLANKSRSEATSYVKKILDKKIKEFENANKSDESMESNESDQFEKRRSNIFIDEILRLSMQLKCFTETDMIYESLTMMSGGFDTIALTVSYIVLMLAIHPEYQEKVFQEINDIFPEQLSDVTAEDIAKLDYTDRFIKETMRFTPTVPLITRCAKKDMQIGQYTIPAGTELIVSIFNLHRNPLAWGASAGVFDPDHFLPEVWKKQHPYSFVPFSAGLRNYIGLKYGNIVIRLFVCWLVRNYRFTTDLKLDQLRFRINVTMKIEEHHMVHVHKRENY